MGKYDARLMEIAGQQHFAVSRDQLLEIGSEDQLEYRIANKTLERRFQCAYRLASSPRNWKQDLTAGTFAGGKLSVASFRSAAALQYLPGGEELTENHVSPTSDGRDTRA